MSFEMKDLFRSSIICGSSRGAAINSPGECTGRYFYLCYSDLITRDERTRRLYCDGRMLSSGPGDVFQCVECGASYSTLLSAHRVSNLERLADINIDESE